MFFTYSDVPRLRVGRRCTSPSPLHRTAHHQEQAEAVYARRHTDLTFSVSARSSLGSSHMILATTYQIATVTP